MSIYKQATIQHRDGLWAPAILLANGHTVHKEFKYIDPQEAQKAADEWFEKEQAGEPVPAGE